MAPQVSVLLPVHNGARTLERALASVQAQTWGDWELIAVENGSSDATANILREAQAADARIRVVTLPQPDLVAALQAGIKAARGSFVARLDADDECDPARLERQVVALQARPEVGLVSCRVRFGGDAVAQSGYARHVVWLNSLLTADAIALHRFVDSPLAHPSVMFRRELVDRHGGYRQGGFPEDYELWLRWLEAGVRMVKLPEVLLTWNDAPSRLSRCDPRYSPAAFFRLKANYLATWLRHHLPAPPAKTVDIWVWGAGRPTRRRVDALRAQNVAVSGYVDIDPRKAGRTLDAVPVVMPEQLPEPGRVFVLVYVTNPGARDSIAASLHSKGYLAGRDYLHCA